MTSRVGHALFQLNTGGLRDASQRLGNLLVRG